MILDKIFLAVLAIGCQFTLADPNITLVPTEFDTSIGIGWIYDRGDLGHPNYYTIQINDKKMEFQQPWMNIYMINKLLPCRTFDIKLDAYFDSTSFTSGHQLISTRCGDPKLKLIEVDHSETSIALSWHYDDSTLGKPDYYDLLVDDKKVRFLPTTERIYILRNLAPCHTYNLTLFAIFPTMPLFSQDLSISTSFQEPGPVSNLRLEKGLLTWDVPTNSECTQAYQVCEQLMQPHSKPTCSQVTKPPMKTDDFEGCASIELEVSAIGQDKKKGSHVSIKTETPFKEPGLPENMAVTAGAGNAVDVTWTLPKHYSCIKSYEIQYGATGSKDMVKIELHNHFYDKEEHVSIGNLPECTDYTFELTQTSSSNHSTAPIKKTLAAKDVEPEEITGLNATQQGKTDSVQIAWNPLKQANCLGKVNVCLLDDKNKTVGCLDEPQPQAHTSVVFDKLGACEHLTAVAKGYSKHATLVGPKSTTDFTTLEKAPSGVQNLKIKSYTPTTLTVSYDAPAISPKCVVSYSVTTTEIGPAQGSSHTSTFTILGSSQTVLQGLKPATKYEISIVAITKSHLSGPAVTGQGVTLPNKQDNKLRVTEPGLNEMHLSYNVSDCSDCIAFQVKYWSAHSSAKSVKFFSSETETMYGIVSNLKECTDYNFLAQSFSVYYRWSAWTKTVKARTIC